MLADSSAAAATRLLTMFLPMGLAASIRAPDHIDYLQTLIFSPSCAQSGGLTRTMEARDAAVGHRGTVPRFGKGKPLQRSAGRPAETVKPEQSAPAECTVLLRCSI